MKKMFSLKNIMFFILILIIVLLSYFYYNQYKKDNTSFLKSITILGETFQLKPGIYVYEFNSDKNILKQLANGSGCELPYTYEISDVYSKLDYSTGGINYFKEGEDYVDFKLRFSYNDEIIAYYYFIVDLNEPLIVEEGCK